MLNDDGGIETDVTVTCLKKNHFRVIGPAATREHDKFHIKKHISEEVNFKDLTEDLTCLGLYGPKSRNLLSNISNKFSMTKLYAFICKIIVTDIR
jgi:4-methylaminobutanoate oxidase (formaldehyde-forming)